MPSKPHISRARRNVSAMTAGSRLKSLWRTPGQRGGWERAVVLSTGLPRIAARVLVQPGHPSTVPRFALTAYSPIPGGGHAPGPGAVGLAAGALRPMFRSTFWLITMANTKITPFRMLCQKVRMFSMSRPLPSTATISAPIRVPMTEPLPPWRLVPPRRMARMASNSNPTPMRGSPAARREAVRIPARTPGRR